MSGITWGISGDLRCLLTLLIHIRDVGVVSSNLAIPTNC